MAVKHLKFLGVGHRAPCNISESNNELQLVLSCIERRAAAMIDCCTESLPRMGSGTF